MIHVLKADDFSFVTKIKGSFSKIEIREGVNIACLSSELKIVVYNYADFENPVTLNHGICRVSDIKYTSNDLFLTGRTENPISVLIWTSENTDHLLTFNENKNFKDFIPFGSLNHKMDNLN